MRVASRLAATLLAAIVVGAAVVGAAVVGAAVPVASAQPGTLGEVLQRAVSRNDIAGAVATVIDGAAATTSSAGFADVDSGRPFGAQTRVRMASITKTFVAATILQLVGEGRVALDAPVEVYLPGALRGVGVDGRSITVRQLLRHQSGLPEYFDSTTDPPTTPTSPPQLLEEALATPGTPPGGAVPVYTNTNYVVAGMIIEAVTGSPAAQEVTRRVITPLGLSHTYFPSPGDTWLRAPMAHGYELDGGLRRDVTAAEPSGEYTAGSLISTTEDTAAFIAALLDGRVLRPAELAQMTATVPWPLHGPGFAYGLGLIGIDLGCGVTVWGHSGDLAGYHSVMAAQPGGRAVSATFTQGSPGVATIVDDPRYTVLTSAFCR